jgi:hypothetical protein
MRKKHSGLLIIGVIGVAVAASCTVAPPPPPPPAPAPLAAPAPPPAAGGIPGRHPAEPFRAAPRVAGVLPDPALTPGTTNPRITQSTINQTICNPNWSTKSIRPPPSYTNRLKQQELQSGYTVNGDTNPADYELDHLISLELGGNPTDRKNLWPEPWEHRGARLAAPGTGAESKDAVENQCHRAVCAGAITLAAAQQQIATDWRTACK